MSNAILTYNTFTEDTFDYNAPRANQNGLGKNVGIFNKNSKSALNVTTPQLRTYGISDYEGNQRYQLTFQFPESGTDAKADAFLEKMKNFEAKVKADAVTNSKEWFGKAKMTPEVVEALWSPMIKYPKTDGEVDYTRAPTLNVKTPYYANDGKWDFEVYNTSNERLFPDPDSSLTPLDLMPKGSGNAGALIRCGGIWFASGKFGVTWKLLQAKIKPKTSITGVCQIPMDDDDIKAMESTSSDQEEEVDTHVESDDEEEEESQPEPEPEPVKPKKKVVRKKAAE